MLPQPRPESVARAPQSGIRDNFIRGSVADFLASKIQPGADLSIVSAFFTIYAFDALQPELAGINQLRFLFGEPRFLRSLDPERTDKKAFKIEDEDLALANRLEQKRAARECADWICQKAQIRSVRHSSILHGKMYHIAHEKVEDAILGSSNFTLRGLGLSPTANNIELNLEVDSNRDRKDLKAWFDQIWASEFVEDVKDEVLLYLEQLYVNHAPEFIYFKTLFHIFDRFLEAQHQGGLLFQNTQIVETRIWRTLFEFQKDAVKGAINKINAHNGCIIADSVGLGKTFEALAVIKYFELRNHKVLVLCPKKLRENWTIYQAQNNSELNPFVDDRLGYTVLCHSDLSRDGGKSGDIDLAAINWGNFDLVVIDESHNFRNNLRGKRDEEGNIVRRSRYERLMEEVLKRGVRTKVLLISATPVNTDLKDLRNQLYFITEGRDDSFRDSIGITSLKEALASAQRTFNEWAKAPGERKTSVLLERLSSAFFTLLDELTIARSRKHILKYYKDSLQSVGHFPERKKPESVFAEIDTDGRFPTYDRLNDEILAYKLSLFRPSEYVLPEFQPLYSRQLVLNFTQEQREYFLIGMMKVNFLKRLESSVHSFAITMGRTVAKIQHLQARIERFQQQQTENPDVDLANLDLADVEDDELREALEVGRALVYKMAHLDLDRWKKDLRRDQAQLEYLAEEARKVHALRDAKIGELKKIIEHKIANPSITADGRTNRKMIVFTAFADTADYLYQVLKGWIHGERGVHLALVSGGSIPCRTTFGKPEFNHILTNFSPIAKNRSKMKAMPQEGEIDLLIGTDCISEGQNLQDCDLLINYDIHWNPVRIIQRFGRIDRIGSRNKSVHLVNFWPTQDLNKYINLKNRVEARMALVDIAATSEDNVLTTDELQELIKDDLKYRDKQLLRLKDEILDLEDFNESVALSEFTLDDFRVEFAKYIEANRFALQEAPLGLYAVVRADPQHKQIQPGVIYCLRQRGDTSGNETVNPLQPYFLVYVWDDGTVRYTFAQPKQILEIYRLLCVNQTAAIERLCDAFDRETKNGSDMTRYSGLLRKAVASIESTFRKRAASNLLSSRSGLLTESSRQVTSTTDFDLITWLVIR
ncbi:MAG TPA: helicase-related protein [Bryobacteraceae bacterium]